MSKASYLEKTIGHYWDLEEAIASTIKERNCSFDSAESIIRSKLDQYNHLMAKEWKKNWKELIRNVKEKIVFERQETESSTSSATYNQTFSAPTKNTFNAYTNKPRSVEHEQFMNNLFDDSAELEEISEINKRKGRRKEKSQPKKAKNNDREELFLPVIPSKSNIDPEDYIRDPPLDPFVLTDGNSLGQLFINYQLQSAQKLKNMILIESDTHEIFAINNILLIKNGQHSKLLLETFGEKNLNEIKKKVFEKFYVDDSMYQLPSLVRDNICMILKNLRERKITTRAASKQLTNLTSDEDNNFIDSLIISVRNLVEHIPSKKMNGVICEDNISHNHLHQIINPIFTRTEKHLHLSWLNTQVIDCSSKQPDFGVSSIQSVCWSGPLIIGEVKGEDKKDDLYLCLGDLLRVGMLSVDVINAERYNGVISVHVVGLQTTFYITTLLANRIYVMVEICSISMPRDTTELREYVSCMEDLIHVSDIFSNLSIVSGDELSSLEENITTDVIRTPEFKRMLEQTRDRSRSSPIVYKH